MSTDELNDEGEEDCATCVDNWNVLVLVEGWGQLAHHTKWGSTVCVAPQTSALR